MSSEQLGVQTKILHPHSSHPLNAHTFPIFQTSTFTFDSTQQGADLFQGKGEGYIYSRLGNPTVELYEEMVSDQVIRQEIDKLIEYKTTSKEMDMSEVPFKLVDYAKELASYYIKVVNDFRPVFDNTGVNEDLNRLFFNTVNCHQE